MEYNDIINSENSISDKKKLLQIFVQEYLLKYQYDIKSFSILYKKDDNSFEINTGDTPRHMTFNDFFLKYPQRSFTKIVNDPYGQPSYYDKLHPKEPLTLSTGADTAPLLNQKNIKHFK